MLVYEVNSRRGEIKSGADPGFAFRGGARTRQGAKPGGVAPGKLLDSRDFVG